MTEEEILERAFRALDGLAARPAKTQAEAKISENCTSRRCTPETPTMSVQTPPAASPKQDSASSKTSEAAEPTQPQIDAAGKVLAESGVRLIGGDHGVDYAGIWSDLDGPEVRAAIAVFHSDGVPIRYLDGDVPMRFKLRRVRGEPVPANVLAAMKREPDKPWKVRDRMLAEMGWNPEPVLWAQYQAERLNKLFQEQGATEQPGKVRLETVRHGEL